MFQKNNTPPVHAEHIPIVRVTLDSMKASIMHMLDPKTIHDAIEQRLNDAITNFDFDTEVKIEASKCISNAVESFFKYGIGRSIVRSAVQAALTETLDKLISKDKKN